MIEKWNVTIPQLSGDMERRAYVYVPDQWEENSEERYPVLYMFDGHNVFFDEDATYGKSWGMAEFLEEAQPPLIIAAVECNRAPDNSRLQEYCPFTFDDPKFGHVTGRGRTTMEWLGKEFKPYIDENYPTIPDREYTFIAGSSMGGLMTLYAVTAYNHVFSRGAALSPSLWTSPWKIDMMLRRSRIAPGTVLYMDYGSEELGWRSMEKIFGKVSARLLEKKVHLTSRIVPNGDHCEACWEEQIPLFMEILQYNRE